MFKIINKSNLSTIFKVINSRNCLSMVAITMLATTLPHHVFAEIEMPKEQQTGEIRYMTGGIAEEAEMMRAIAKEFPLEIVLIQKSKAREEFLADVKVQLLNASHQLLLETSTEGPYLYVKLPDGQYWVIATFNNEVKKQKVMVRANKHQKVVVWWPIVEPFLPDDTLENSSQNDVKVQQDIKTQDAPETHDDEIQDDLKIQDDLETQGEQTQGDSENI